MARKWWKHSVWEQTSPVCQQACICSVISVTTQYLFTACFSLWQDIQIEAAVGMRWASDRGREGMIWFLLYTHGDEQYYGFAGSLWLSLRVGPISETRLRLRIQMSELRGP